MASKVPSENRHINEHPGHSIRPASKSLSLISLKFIMSSNSPINIQCRQSDPNSNNIKDVQHLQMIQRYQSESDREPDKILIREHFFTIQMSD